MVNASVIHTVVAPTSAGAARRSAQRRAALGLSVAIGGSIASLLLAWLLLAREQTLAEVQFKLDAGKRVGALQRAVAERLGAVSTVTAFFCGSQLVERKEFHTFTAPIMQRHSGMLALAWVPRIPAARRLTQEQTVRKEGFPRYEITQRDDKGHYVSAGKRDEYYPILFVEPFRQNRSLLGFDLGSDAKCCAAIREALVTRRPAVTVCPALDDNEIDRNLLYVIEPAWNENAEPIRRPADQPEVDGFVLGIFRIGTLVENSLSLFAPARIDMYITLPATEGNGTAVYTHLSPLHARKATQLPPAAPQGGMHFRSSVIVDGSRWAVDCVPLASYLAQQQRSWGPAGTLLVGLAMTGLLVGYLLLLTGRTARVEQLVVERTRELGESEQRFRRLVDNAGDAFFLHNEQGKLLDVSRRACDTLGYTRDELLSMTVAEVDETFDSEDLGRFWKCPDEDYPVTVHGVHRRKDGTTFPVEIRLASLDAGGQRLMLALARDVTDRKRAEDALHQEQRLLRKMLDLHEQERGAGGLRDPRRFGSTVGRRAVSISGGGPAARS